MDYEPKALPVDQLQRENLPIGGFALAESRAALMLREGLSRAKMQRNMSGRKIAQALGYKQSVVLSHMASGRVPIPLERAVEIADAVGIPAATFLVAALEQREPQAAKLLSLSVDAGEDPFVGELCALAGGALCALPEGHKQILREVVTDRLPARRWLALAEIPAVDALRRSVPDFSTQGLTPYELRAVTARLGSADT